MRKIILAICSSALAVDDCMIRQKDNAELLENHLLDFTADVVPDDLLNHGCFCSAFNGGASKAGPPVSELDKICRDYRHCNRCHSKKECGEESGFDFCIDINFQDQWICEESGNNECQQAQCECSMKFSREITNYLKSGGTVEAVDCVEEYSPSRPTQCCGVGMNFLIYPNEVYSCEVVNGYPHIVDQNGEIVKQL